MTPQTARSASSTTLPSLAFVTAIVGVLIIAVLWAVHETDRSAREREESFVTLMIHHEVEKIVLDQENVAIWDEAVESTSGRFDRRWISDNFGPWMFKYFRHDRTFLFDADDRLAYVMADGEDGALALSSSQQAVLMPMVEVLRGRRTETWAKAPTTTLQESYANPRTVRIARFEGRPAIVAAMTIVPDSERAYQVPGSEYVIANVRFLDRDFLAAIEERYLLHDLRFIKGEGSRRGGLGIVSIATDDGEPLGTVIWPASTPGSDLVVKIAPFVLATVLIVGAILFLLVRRTDRAESDRRTSAAEAHHLAFHDPLTGLPNRQTFTDVLERTLDAATPSGEAVAVLYIDLDRFKEVNDSLGHPAGDELLVEVARRLREVTGPRDLVARLSGDEFAVIRRNARETDVAAFAQRVLASQSQVFDLLGTKVFVGCSIGIAIAPDHGDSRLEICRKADIALYVAKSRGRNRFCLFTEAMDADRRRRERIERGLREALHLEEGFHVYFQPFLDRSGQTIVGVEALLRWHHPDGEVVPASEFVPIAEECGLIVDLGERMMEKAFTAAARWPKLRCAVNCSPIQLKQEGFAASVRAVLEKTGFDPRRLELEITETVLNDLSDACRAELESLRQIGVSVALDDFGTGYSSLSHLLSFRIDRIKIDRSFVAEIGRSADSETIVRTIAGLGRSLRLGVTAEGVETHEQFRHLVDIGCDEFQGWLFSRAVPAEEIDALLNRRPRAIA